MKRYLRLGVGLMALSLATAPAHAISLIDGLGGPAGYGALSQAPNDDGSSPEFNIGFSLNFFGQNYSTLYVNNNGNVTFGGSLSSFTPEPFGSGSSPYPIIAPFWADVDTRAGGGVYYSATEDRFIATWHNVGYYSNHNDKTNDFQLILINRDDTGAGNFDIEFRYNRIEWTTGDASGGSNGFGGTPAQAGYDASGYAGGGGGGYGDNGYGGGGYGEPGEAGASSVFSTTAEAGDSVSTFFTLPTSRTDDVKNLDETSNTGEQGYWKFQIRDGSIADGSTPLKPLDPTVFTDDGFQFEFEVTQPDVPIFIDPPVTTGYRYEVTAGGLLITSAIFSTDTGDLDGYQIWTLDGLTQLGTVGNLGTFNFGATGVTGFLLRDITTAAGLDPTDPFAFVTGLTFNTTGQVTVVQTPQDIVDVGAVPEPATWAMMILGFGLAGAAIRRRGGIAALA